MTIITILLIRICFVAPGRYSPERVKLDHSPEYSFGRRTSLDKPDDVPGKWINKDKISHEVVNFRNSINIENLFFHPAPGTYCPEKVKLDHTPQYSFGRRTSVDKTDDVPGKKTDKCL